MNAAEIAQLFHGKRSGNSWMALCPCHDDKQASLSISQGDKGAVVFCHVCGKSATPDILATVDLKMTDLFDTEGTPAMLKLGSIVSDYRYIGLDGNPVMRVTRHSPKTFRQWRPDGGGGWLAGVEGVKKVLYRLPELKGNSVVFVVEGEKDVDRLSDIGVVATCNVGGASTWSTDYVQQLIAVGVERVVVLSDNDAAGKKHAHEIAESSFNAGLKVKLMALDGLPDKGDVSDWLDAGHSKDDLFSLVKSTEVYIPSPKSTTDTITAVEQTLIGIVLRKTDYFPPLHADEFSSVLHRCIWQGIRDMYESDGLVMMSALAHEIRERWVKLSPTLDPITYLTSCMDISSGGEGEAENAVTTLAKQVRNFGRAAQVKKIGAELMASGMSPDEAQAKLDELPGPLTGAIYDPADNWLNIQKRWKTGVYLKTGFWQLDELTQGFSLGDLTIIAGRTSHGKTAFAKSCQRRLAQNHIKTEYITLEETADSITRRHISEGSEVPNYKIKAGPPTLTEQEFELCENEVIKLQELDFTVTALDTISSLDEDTVVGCIANSEASVIFLDHIQKVNTRGESRAYGIERVLNRFHSIGIKQNKCIVVLWQFNREMDKEGRRPVLGDMRDSGSAEIAGRMIWLLCWPKKLMLDPKELDVIDPYAYEVNVAKYSDGGTGLIELRFDFTTGGFSDIVPKPAQNVVDFSQAAGLTDTF